MMLLKRVFIRRSVTNSLTITLGISAKGGKLGKENALIDEQVKLLLETVRELPPYVRIMIGLYSGLGRKKFCVVGLRVVLDVPTKVFL